MISCRTPLPIYSKKYKDFDTMIHYPHWTFIKELNYYINAFYLYCRFKQPNRDPDKWNKYHMFETELLNELKTEQ